MKKGDKVYYYKVQRGGYGFEFKYPAVVVKVNQKTVRIRLAKVNFETHKNESFEVTVKPEKLGLRDKDCSFESVLFED